MVISLKKTRLNWEPATTASSCCLCLNETITVKIDWEAQEGFGVEFAFWAWVSAVVIMCKIPKYLKNNFYLEILC